MSGEETNIKLRLKEAEFRYLTTVMTMYIDNVKGYIQVATGALLLPIIFLRNVMGLKQDAPLTWIPGPMVFSWILLLLSIGAGLLYQVRAVRYVELEMEGEDEDDLSSGSLGAKIRERLDTNPGYIFDVMAVAFYLGTAFL